MATPKYVFNLMINTYCTSKIHHLYVFWANKKAATRLWLRLWTKNALVAGVGGGYLLPKFSKWYGIVVIVM